MISELEKNLAQRVTVGDIFRRHARHAPDKTALVDKRGDREIRLNYRELNTRMNRFANALTAQGYGPGDRVAFICLNTWEFIVSLFGCAKGGTIVVPLNPAMSPDDLVYMINQSESTCIVADDIFTPMIDGIKSQCPGLKHFISIPLFGGRAPEYFLAFDEFIKDQSEAEIETIIWERDTFGIYYTSGTTSRPKGTVLSHLTLYIMTLCNAIEFGLKRGTSSIMALPAFHAAQNGINLVVMLMEGKLVISRAFNAVEVLETVQTEKITFMLLLPMLWKVLLEAPQRKDYDLSSLDFGIYAMAPLDKPTLTRLIEEITPNFFLATGQTEFIPSTENFKPEWQLRKTGNYWGEPAICVETVIMDDYGRILPRGEVGEIVRRGGGTLTEYLKNPEATNEKLKWGWAHSEDIGYFDEDWQLAFVDRKKDMIKTGGENVPSLKVEQVILGHPKISEVAVVGLPHERWSEAITAFVVLKPGSDLGEEEIVQYCKRELGGFEVPKKVVLVDRLPKTSTGKLQKNVLKKQYQSLYAEG
ncbi:MAG: AMP-binding protein [Thermodesulfobacteriota bacterium]